MSLSYRQIAAASCKRVYEYAYVKTGQSLNVFQSLLVSIPIVSESYQLYFNVFTLFCYNRPQLFLDFIQKIL